MRKSTIIYGGAFNPPTIAHQTILQKCVDFAGNDVDVWLLPSGDRTDKTIAVPRNVRLNYLDAMIQDVTHPDKDIRIELTELDRGFSVETYDTVCELNIKYPDREFVWVFGADSTETMASWKNGKWLMENVPMLIIERPGNNINPNLRRWNSLQIPLLDVSSTELRRRLDASEPFTDLVGASVLQVLQTQHI